MGTDLAPAALREAAREVAGIPALRFAAMDAENLALKDAAVDLVISSEVLEHLLSPGAALEEMRRVVRPGGWIVLTTPNPWAAVERYEAFKRWVYRVFFGRILIVRKRQIFDQPIPPRELDALARHAGLRIVYRAGTHYFPPRIRGRVPFRGLAERLSRIIERFNLLPYFGLYQILLLGRTD